MNAHTTAGIRELTAQELDQVTGGITYNPWEGLVIGAMIGTVIGGLLDWLFD